MGGEIKWNIPLLNKELARDYTNIITGVQQKADPAISKYVCLKTLCEQEYKHLNLCASFCVFIHIPISRCICECFMHCACTRLD